MSRDDSNYDNSDVLNSSFYSSTSINTMDHVKTFRNSFVLADLNDPYYNGRLPESQYSEDVGSDEMFSQPSTKDKEIATMKMSTSPSLSALAGILNEKSRQANEKLRSSTIIDSSIVEEDDDENNPISQTVDVPSTGEASPNLFELNDNEEVYCPQVTPSSKSYISTQPDFLSTPKITTEYTNVNQHSKTPQDESRVESRRVISEVPASGSNLAKSALPTPQRTVSASVTVDQNSHSKKKKNFFSFLRRRHTGDSLTSDNLSPKIPNSTTFSLGSTRSSQLPSEKLTKKSYSSNNLFSTFRKNKEVKNANEGKNLTNHEVERAFNESCLASNDENKHESAKPSLPKKDISKRKPTPLSYEHLENKRASDAKKLESPKMQQGTALDEERSLPLPPKLDSGEAVFPKYLDKQEVDSIVSLERSRSTKSNKRSSVASHRRSFTDTLSVNAQNEGMYVMEASSVVLSTPDLGKSPASSILRNGKFESMDFSSNNSNIQDDLIEMNKLSSDEPPLKLETMESQHLMGSIEEKLKDLIGEPEAEVEPIQKEAASNTFDDDPEFMSDIMEFANIINFGDGVNFDFDSTSLEPKVATLEPPSMSNREVLSEGSVQPTEQTNFAAGLGISSNVEPNNEQGDNHLVEVSPEAPVERAEDDEFENEDFNNLYENPQETPRLRAYIPEIDIQRPISMSFRGLKAPGFNASITGSSATESLVRGERMSFASAERRPVNNVIFSSKIILYDTYSEEEYDRKPDVATCNQLTPQLAQLIKAELNDLKSEMEVHEESRCYTHYF